ncbi:hypothetical protein [Methylobacterium sp. WL19]|uniref:hypothetical protein n=1 Tax=Methylobacterium sp. WL19 TaxID=2603896 RepID=UPI0011C807CA|nr:hypothetical protein [Methylobacterium sp. WL19]TXN20049.1 hypothetical protein FV220_24470 [Methylobacterium sp. WL19]
MASGASLRDVVARFDLPAVSSLHRHRAQHLGREVRFHLPPAAPHVATVTVNAAHQEACPSEGANGPGTSDTGAAASPEHVLEGLFTRANVENGRTLQDYARLLVDGLAHTYAAAVAANDLSVTVRALRELRALLQFHALVPPDRLRQLPGWVEPAQERDPIFAMQQLLLGGMPVFDGIPGAEQTEAEALAELDKKWPGFSERWAASNPTTPDGNLSASSQ